MPILWALLIGAVFAAYSNHFHNSFHFDDVSTIELNPYIRDLRYIPQMFTDARTVSVNPVNQIYRPVVFVMLAVDYWLAGGLEPTWYHVDVFGFYLLLLIVMYPLFQAIARTTAPQRDHAVFGLFAVGWFALHPVSAETINYMYQRGELYATLGVVAGLAAYAVWRKGRRFGLYLIPPLLGMLAKQSAIMFGPILFVYVVMFETSQESRWQDRLKTAVNASIPAFVVCSLYFVLQNNMTSATWTGGAPSVVGYWLAQPMSLLHYFASFFLPIHLTADTDRQPLTTPLDPSFVVGTVFVLAMLYVIWRLRNSDDLRPVVFGLLWFLLASAPTTIMPVDQVENDHRMFFPFVGLSLAICWAGRVYWDRWQQRVSFPAAIQTAMPLVLAAMLAVYGYGAHKRNEVWKTEESLWRDVTIKSPRNGRGLMNYGRQLVERDDNDGGLQYYRKALEYTPDYPVLHLNLAIVSAKMGDDAEAEKHFQRALALDTTDARAHFYYAQWLYGKGKPDEAISHLTTAISKNPTFIYSHYMLMQIYQDQGDVANLKAAAEDTLRSFPNDSVTAEFLASAK
jgi:protein O-mannosyl-transferase